MVRVLVAENMRILRDTLVAVLNLQVVADGNQIVPVALDHEPDVAILDIDLPQHSGEDRVDVAEGVLVHQDRRRPGQTHRSRAPADSSKARTFRLLLDLVAEDYHAVFEQGGLNRRQVVPILEDAGPLAA
jgi:hypothetical protein